jgi:hypothetical protein
VPCVGLVGHHSKYELRRDAKANKILEPLVTWKVISPQSRTQQQANFTLRKIASFLATVMSSVKDFSINPLVNLSFCETGGGTGAHD